MSSPPPPPPPPQTHVWILPQVTHGSHRAFQLFLNRRQHARDPHATLSITRTRLSTNALHSLPHVPLVALARRRAAADQPRLERLSSLRDSRRCSSDSRACLTSLGCGSSPARTLPPMDAVRASKALALRWPSFVVVGVGVSPFRAPQRQRPNGTTTATTHGREVLKVDLAHGLGLVLGRVRGRGRDRVERERVGRGERARVVPVLLVPRALHARPAPGYDAGAARHVHHAAALLGHVLRVALQEHLALRWLVRRQSGRSPLTRAGARPTHLLLGVLHVAHPCRAPRAWLGLAWLAASPSPVSALCSSASSRRRVGQLFRSPSRRVRRGVLQVSR